MKLIRLIFFLVFTTLTAFAAVPPLEREISLNLNSEKLVTAFDKIHEQTQLVFSYPASLVGTVSPVTIQIKNKTVREALLLLLPRNITFKARDNYIILKPKPKDKDTSKVQISGYVYDKNTEKKLPSVTIYDRQTLQSTTTDEYGFYTIAVPAETQSLNITKESYSDTALAVNSFSSQAVVNFTIAPASRFRQIRDSLKIRQKLLAAGNLGKKMLSDFSGYVNSLNISDTITRAMQVSFVPFVGSNHRMSGAVYNHLSFNVLGGYSRGLKGAEFGGLFNIEKESMKGIQVAGLFNIVGDSAEGTQFAGLMNVNGLHSGGLQAAGLMNITGGKQQGIQAAGLMNVSGSSQGLSAAGLLNISGKTEGSAVAGLANFCDTLEGIAMAGLINASDYSKNAAQLSSILNSSRAGSSVLQVSAFYNRASYLKGTQIAFVNYADSAAGVPFGLLSVVKKGLHQLELSYDELFSTNLTIRTGVNAFHNIFTAGIRPGTPYWQVGYGLGTSIKISSHFRSDFNVTVQHISKGQLYFSACEAWRFYAGLEYRPGKNFGIAAGPTFNYYITDLLTPEYLTDYSGVTPKALHSGVTPFDYRYKTWIGMRVALRFF